MQSPLISLLRSKLDKTKKKLASNIYNLNALIDIADQCSRITNSKIPRQSEIDKIHHALLQCSLITNSHFKSSVLSKSYTDILSKSLHSKDYLQVALDQARAETLLIAAIKGIEISLDECNKDVSQEIAQANSSKIRVKSQQSDLRSFFKRDDSTASKVTTTLIAVYLVIVALGFIAGVSSSKNVLEFIFALILYGIGALIWIFLGTIVLSLVGAIIGKFDETAKIHHSHEEERKKVDSTDQLLTHLEAKKSKVAQAAALVSQFKQGL